MIGISRTWPMDLTPAEAVSSDGVGIRMGDAELDPSQLVRSGT